MSSPSPHVSPPSTPGTQRSTDKPAPAPPVTQEPPHERGILPPRSVEANPSFNVRAADLEPYIGLRYLSWLFKLMAVVLVILLVSEVITGLMASGTEAFGTLLGEASRLVVLAGLLWGSGDLAILFIDIGHDVRATRILVGRQLAHHIADHHAHVDPQMAGVVNPS